MTLNDPSWNAQIEAYLDGTLEGQALQDFNARLASDARLQHAIKLQEEIDRALRRRFVIPAHVPLSRQDAAAQAARVSANGVHAGDLPRLADVHAAATASATPTPALPGALARYGYRRMAIAAVIIVSVTGAILAWYFMQPQFASSGGGGDAHLTFGGYYNRKVETGFKPAWVCKDNKEFAARFHKQLGQETVMRDLPSGMQCAGVDYCHTLTLKSLAVLINYNDSRIVVFADRLSKDSGPSAVGPDLRVFRRELGSLVLYEVSPLQQPQVLDLFEIPNSGT